MKIIIAIYHLLLMTLSVTNNLGDHSCTAVFIARDNMVLVGNNEDWWDPESRLWTVRGVDNTLGRFYWGFGDLIPQGGMNEKGLFFDGFGAPYLEVKNSVNRTVFNGLLADKAMSECSTVDEVLELFSNYDLSFLEEAQLIFGDALGNSVIIEGDSVIMNNKDYQVVTNFYLSQVKNHDIDCPRYLKASGILSSGVDVSCSLIKDILKVTSQRSTQYSVVCDLKSLIINVYHFGDFSKSVIFHLEEELSKEERIYDIPSLFPENTGFRKIYYPNRMAGLDISTDQLVIVLLLLLGLSLTLWLLGPILNWREVTSYWKRYGIYRKHFKIFYLFGICLCIINIIYLSVLRSIPIGRAIHIITIARPAGIVDLPLMYDLLILLPVLSLIISTIYFVILIFLIKKKVLKWVRSIYFIIYLFFCLILLIIYQSWDVLVVNPGFQISRHNKSIIMKKGETSKYNDREKKYFGEIKDFRETDIRYSKERNIEGLVSLWDDKGVLLIQGIEPVIGKSSIEAYFTESENNDISIERYSFDFHETRIIDDHAYEWGNYDHCYIDNSSGNVYVERGKLFRILKRDSSGWKAVLAVVNK